MCLLYYDDLYSRHREDVLLETSLPFYNTTRNRNTDYDTWVQGCVKYKSEANECYCLHSIIVKVFNKHKHYKVPPLVGHIPVTVLLLRF
jgi:predicted aldo/keto reductase-like oxidoreductase